MKTFVYNSTIEGNKAGVKFLKHRLDDTSSSCCRVLYLLISIIFFLADQIKFVNYRCVCITDVDFILVLWERGCRPIIESYNTLNKLHLKDIKFRWQ